MPSSHYEHAVLLCTPTEADRAEFVALRRASAVHFRAWEPTMDSDEQQFGDPSFDRQLERVHKDTEEPFLIRCASDNTLVGYVGLGQIHRGPFCSCFMGYWIGTPFLNKGYGTAGVAACLEKTFEPEANGGLGLHRVEANIIPSNAASLALVKRVGFRKEGYSPHYLKINGTWQDHERWAITTEDWAEYWAD